MKFEKLDCEAKFTISDDRFVVSVEVRLSEIQRQEFAARKWLAEQFGLQLETTSQVEGVSVSSDYRDSLLIKGFRDGALLVDAREIFFDTAYNMRAAFAEAAQFTEWITENDPSEDDQETMYLHLASGNYAAAYEEAMMLHLRAAFSDYAFEDKDERSRVERFIKQTRIGLARFEKLTGSFENEVKRLGFWVTEQRNDEKQ